MHYYNEFDPFAADWLAQLMAADLIPFGLIDRRSIKEVQGSDLEGYTQCHFFAGIGGWPYALQLAGWPEDRPVWTGSCPCQPFSVAGQGRGVADERHLWPEFQRLIGECRPPVVLGEQVASKDGRGWLAGVRADLEALGYAVGAADLCAAGVGAPHIRQRLYWVGHANEPGSFPGASTGIHRREEGAGPRHGEPERPGAGSGLAQSDDPERRTDSSRRNYSSRAHAGRPEVAGHPGERSEDRGLADTDLRQPGAERGDVGEVRGVQEAQRQPEHGASLSRGGGEECGNGGLADTDDEGSQGRGRDVLPERAGECSPWSVGASWLDCRDDKRRRVEPSIPLLAHGVSNRVGKLRGFGNAIVPQVAAEFVKAYREAVT